MPLYHDPQPLAQLRARYPDAVATIHDVESVRLGVAPDPSSDPRHVFDWPDGLHMIVSRGRLPCGHVVIHFSASVRPGSPAHLAVERAVVEHGREACLPWVEGRFRLLSGWRGEVRFLGWSEGKGVPHWHVPQPQPDPMRG